MQKTAITGFFKRITILLFDETREANEKLRERECCITLISKYAGLTIEEVEAFDKTHCISLRDIHDNLLYADIQFDNQKQFVKNLLYCFPYAAARYENRMINIVSISIGAAPNRDQRILQLRDYLTPPSPGNNL